MTTKRIGAREARNNFADLIGLVHYNGEAVIVERSGKPMVAIISIDQFEQMDATLHEPRPRVEYPLADELVNGKRSTMVRELRGLFKTTQALPVAQAISETEIADEVAAYRAAQA